MDLTTLREESCGFMLRVMCKFGQVQAINSINALILWWVCIGLITIDIFLLIFPSSFLVCGHHDISWHLTLASRRQTWQLCHTFCHQSGLIFFEWALHIMLFVVVIKQFPLFRRDPGSIQNACIFHIGWHIARMASIVFLALDSAALLGVGLRGGSSSLLLPSKNGMVGLFPLGIFGRCSYFVNFLRNFHALGYTGCILVGTSFKIPPLYLGLFWPRVGDSVGENLVQFFMVHFLGGAWSREKRKVVSCAANILIRRSRGFIIAFLIARFGLLSALMGNK